MANEGTKPGQPSKSLDQAAQGSKKRMLEIMAEADAESFNRYFAAAGRGRLSNDLVLAYYETRIQGVEAGFETICQFDTVSKLGKVISGIPDYTQLKQEYEDTLIDLLPTQDGKKCLEVFLDTEFRPDQAHFARRCREDKKGQWKLFEGTANFKAAAVRREYHPILKEKVLALIQDRLEQSGENQTDLSDVNEASDVAS